MRGLPHPYTRRHDVVKARAHLDRVERREADEAAHVWRDNCPYGCCWFTTCEDTWRWPEDRDFLRDRDAIACNGLERVSPPLRAPLLRAS